MNGCFIMRKTDPRAVGLRAWVDQILASRSAKIRCSWRHDGKTWEWARDVLRDELGKLSYRLPVSTNGGES